MPAPTIAPAPPPSPASQETLRALQHFLRAVQLRDRDRICCHDISVVQGHLLDLLAERGPLGMGEVADGLLHDRSTASRVAAGLEAKGYVERTRCPEDARVVHVTLTAAGARLQRVIERSLLDDQTRLLADLPEELLEGLPDLFRGLAHRTLCCLDPETRSC